MGTPIKSGEPVQQPPAPPAEPKGLDNPQIQANVKPDDSPVRDYSRPEGKVILQGEEQVPLEKAETKKAMTPEERAQRKARLAVLLDRGIVQDRLSVPLPPDIHGEWVRNDPLEIQRLRSFGFEVDDKFALSRSLHNDGTGTPVIGDVIFMTTSRENKELIDEIRQEQIMASNNPRRKQREEKQFEEKTGKDTGGLIPTFVESQTRSVRKEELAAALTEADNQTKPVINR